MAEAIARSHEDVLSDKDKRRFLEDIKDNFWISRNHGPVVAQVKAELGMGDRESSACRTVLEPSAKDEVAEAAEETDTEQETVEETEQEVSEEEEVIEAAVGKKA